MYNLKVVYNFLKQMISKYFPWPLVATLHILLFTSCLGSSNEGFEYSPDAQIYSFSLSSRADTSNLLNAINFDIDQVNGKIYNKEPLPYLFHVDSALVKISSSSAYRPFYQIAFTLSGEMDDSTYYWNWADSVAINRLKRIITTAPDGQSTKQYSFQLNIYQEDPYLLSWIKKGTDYIPSTPVDQKTIAFNGQFITYYKTESTVKGMFTDNEDGTSWSQVDLTGLPHNIRLKSLFPLDKAIYAINEGGEVYKSDSRGVAWSRVTTEYVVESIYGMLPSAKTSQILLTVNDGNSLRFALTDYFSEIQLMNPVPDEIPLSDFTATSVEDPNSFASKYIILADGINSDNARNNDIYILQEKGGEITYISTTPRFSINGSNLFYYDRRLYLMIESNGKNSFLLSDNFGLEWIVAEDNQAFPSTSNYIPRTNASVVIDDDNNIWIFGGISANQAQTQLVDAWRGRLNKFSMN